MAYHLIGKTSDNKIFSAKRQWSNSSTPSTDMYLLKVDASLQTDSISPDNSTYDSLCPQPINYSDVLLSNCHVVTNLQELMEKAPKTEGYRATFSIHPNPAGDRIHFRFEEPVMQGQLESYVYNTHGRLLLQPSGYHIRDNGIDVSSLPAGFYMVQLFHKGNSLGTQKLIKR